MPSTNIRRFTVQALHEQARAVHAFDGDSAEHAAVLFVETWTPAPDDDGEVTLRVTDCETGQQCCLTFDLQTGEVASCA